MNKKSSSQIICYLAILIAFGNCFVHNIALNIFMIGFAFVLMGIALVL